MADPIGPRYGATPVATTVSKSLNETPAGIAAGMKAGVKFGPKEGVGAEVKTEAGHDNFGGGYVDGGGQFSLNTPLGGINGEGGGRYYPDDQTGKFSRRQFEWSADIGRKGANAGRSDKWNWDNNPVTPEYSGKRWNQTVAKTVERVGADDLQRDGASEGMHLGITGVETDYRFHPNGFRYEANSYFGLLGYKEHDVLGLVTYDPPSAKAYVTDNYGVGIARIGIYGSSMEERSYDANWALDISADYRGETPGRLGDAARYDAIGSYNQMSVFRGNAEVLDGLGLGSEEAYLKHIEETVARTKLPGKVVVQRMDRAVRDAALTMENDPTKTVTEAFAEQPKIDRRNSLEQALSQGKPPDVALELAMARANGDTRPDADILDDIKMNGLSRGAAIANDALAFATVISGVTETPTNFDAVVAAGSARNAGDGRSVGALVTDYYDNGRVDGSNVVQATIGSRSYGVTPGGAVVTTEMPDGSVRVGQTTLTLEEYASRQAAHDVPASSTPRRKN